MLCCSLAKRVSYHSVSMRLSVLSQAPSMQDILLMLDGGMAVPSIKKSKGGATVTLDNCTVEVSPMDGRMVVTSVEAQPVNVPILLLLAAEHAASGGHELFVPSETPAHDIFSGYDACSVRDGECAGQHGAIVLYMGPKLLKRKRRKQP